MTDSPEVAIVSGVVVTRSQRGVSATKAERGSVARSGSLCDPRPRPRGVGLAVMLWVFAFFAALAATAVGAEADDAGQVTFNRDLAPVVFRHCAPCHRPGGTGPFSLLDYAGARKRAKEMAEVTAKRLMPPWLPAPGHGEFLDVRRLSDDEAQLFQRWLAGGVLEGKAESLPPAPGFSMDWELGKPDLIVQMPKPYELGPEGPDVYRNFVVPLALASNRFVQAFEFQPRNQSIHHVRILLDRTGQCRRLDKQDAAPGFSGMTVPARFPPGHLLSWAPGRQPHRNDADSAWLLEAGSDLVLQIHMQRTGKQETIQPRVGFYFTDTPPGRTPFVMGLVAQIIDIPAGATNYTVTREFELPSEVELLAVMPHAHYLAREVRFTATLPDRTSRSLLWIPRWDFNWQEEYRYRQPVILPQGTRLEFAISYDNSTANIRNPNHPPRRVKYGPQTTDEMGELWLQVFPRGAEGLARIERAYKIVTLKETAAHFENLLGQEPRNANAHLELGKTLGALGRKEDAFDHLARAVELSPDLVEAHHYIGLYFLEREQWDGAREAFQTAIGLDPDYYRSHTGLGLVALAEGKLEEAERELQTALKLNPADDAVRHKLGEVSEARRASGQRPP